MRPDDVTPTRGAMPTDDVPPAHDDAPARDDAPAHDDATSAVAPRAARPGTRLPLLLLAVALDVACVVGFSAAGRASHDGVGGLAGVLGTAWPFLVAAAIGWAVLRAWRAPARVRPTGVGVWACTWAAGLALRGLAGGGLAVPFVVVSAAVLAATLLGWRVVATAVSRSARGRRRSG